MPGTKLYSQKITRGGQTEPRTIINQFKNVVDVINKKFFDHEYAVFGQADQWIHQMAFGSNVIFLLKKGKADCDTEVDYIWHDKLAEDCPARKQKNVISLVKGSLCENYAAQE